MARRVITLTQNLPLSFRLNYKDGSGGATGLTPTIKVINPDGTLATLGANTLAEVNAIELPGVYEYEVQASDLTQYGPEASLSAMHQAIVDPNNVLVDDPPVVSFERIVPTAPPAIVAGSLTDLETRRDSLIRRRESLVSKIAAGDKSVDYDLSLVGAALAEIDRQIAASGGTVPIRQVRMYGRKGL